MRATVVICSDCDKKLADVKLRLYKASIIKGTLYRDRFAANERCAPIHVELKELKGCLGIVAGRCPHSIR